MRIFRGFADARGIRNPVVTTGSFDGVHIGHMTILKRLRMLAEKYDGESVLITFEPHPRKVLYPETAGRDLKLISSHAEKLMLLEKAGLDNVIIVDFTLEFSRITSEQFVRDLLHATLNAKIVVVGFNHHFGFNKEGDYTQLGEWKEKYGFEAEEIPEQEVYHETVSSTRIRQAITEGYIQRANAYLDHYYLINGPAGECVASGQTGMDRFQSMCITDECKLIPPQGIYAVSVEIGQMKSKGMVIILKQEGERPAVLADVFDQPGILPGSDITLYFHKKIYGALNFTDNRAQSKIVLARQEISDLIY